LTSARFFEEARPLSAFELENAIVDASLVANRRNEARGSSFEGFCTIMGEWERAKEGQLGKELMWAVSGY
jgi:hypothetical protein